MPQQETRTFVGLDILENNTIVKMCQFTHCWEATGCQGDKDKSRPMNLVRNKTGNRFTSFCFLHSFCLTPLCGGQGDGKSLHVAEKKTRTLGVNLQKVCGSLSPKSLLSSNKAKAFKVCSKLAGYVTCWRFYMPPRACVQRHPHSSK